MGRVTQARGGAGTVLLIDDHTDVREPNAVALERAGYRVHRAESWNRALALIERDPSPIDLIVTDLVLPDRAGVQEFSELRGRCGRVPVIVFSAYPKVMKLLDGVLDGVVDWIEKPIDVTRIVRAVDRAIAHAG